jgi:hypothetical protein
MRAHILDKPALQAISPAALRAYIVYEGWRKLESFGQFSEIYVKPAEESVELVVPFNNDIRDYASAVSEIIRTLADLESRNELAVYADLSRADRDVIRIGAVGTNNGSIEIDLGRDIVQNARDMLASAACAADDPRRVYRLGSVQRAEEYMRRVLLGQTEHGSFVISLLAPIPPSLSPTTQMALWPEIEQEPYERQVTRTLSQALAAAHRAIIASNRGQGLAAFVDAVLMGVSANLCEAVAAIIDQAHQAEISVTWARTRPTPRPRNKIVFERSDAEVLKEAARQFLLREPRHDERIMGYVTHLRREAEEFDGHITIKALIDGKARSLSADLSPADYETVIQAHREKVPVTLVGDLEREGHRWRVLEPRDILLLQDADEE